MEFSSIVFALFLSGVVAFSLILAYCSVTDSQAPQLDSKA